MDQASVCCGGFGKLQLPGHAARHIAGCSLTSRAPGERTEGELDDTRAETQSQISIFGGVRVTVGAIVALLMATVLASCASTAEPSTEALASDAPQATAHRTPSPSLQSPTPIPSPTAEAVATLANGAIANVSVDALNLRQSADAASASLATLPNGTELFVIGQPKDDGDLRWYRVAVGSFADQLCTDCIDAIGWVATPASGEERWIEEADVACPAVPVSVDQLTTMTSFAHLHCFGGTEFTGTGWADNHCCGYVGSFVFEPGWLAWPPSRFFRASDFYTTLSYSIVPGPGEESASVTPRPGDIVQFTGHFDDPVAPKCLAELNADVDSDLEFPVPDPAELVFTCRLRLVITDFEVIGHEGEGDCGCLIPPSPGTGYDRHSVNV